MGGVAGIGLGWRAELAGLFMSRDEVDPGCSPDFAEVVAENLRPDRLPEAVAVLADRRVPVVPHGVSLGLAGAEPPDQARLRRLADLAEALRSPLVSEHVAFVRAGGSGPHAGMLEAGHLVPPPRTRESLAVLADNVRRAQDQLPVPLALENIAANLRWPEDEYDEPDFLAELVAATGCSLLVDVANLYGSALARGTDPLEELRRLPWAAVAYAHVAGGRIQGGCYLDTHSGPVLEPVLALVAEAVALRPGLGVLLEVDQCFDPDETGRELAAVREAAGRSATSGQAVPA
ncbi:MAG: DUF692 domain-containing protein [Segniliparus sp.]|uniref:DUF692 domain-containing protein n=1 Tax=Segniliparus sp. TaxID=2804064 RepID=UPI003F2F24B9